MKEQLANYNRFLNPHAFREFKFRQWRMAKFARAGIWEDSYQKMTCWQKLAFNMFGRIPEEFLPKFEIYLEKVDSTQ